MLEERSKPTGYFCLGDSPELEQHILKLTQKGHFYHVRYSYDRAKAGQTTEPFQIH